MAPSNYPVLEGMAWQWDLRLQPNMPGGPVRAALPAGGGPGAAPAGGAGSTGGTAVVPSGDLRRHVLHLGHPPQRQLPA